METWIGLVFNIKTRSKAFDLFRKRIIGIKSKAKKKLGVHALILEVSRTLDKQKKKGELIPPSLERNCLILPAQTVQQIPILLQFEEVDYISPFCLNEKLSQS